MKRTITIAASALLSSCFAQTEGDDTACPVVDCGWYAHPETTVQTCAATHEFSSQKHFELLDEGASACWIHDTTCVTSDTQAQCVPDSCRRTFVDCQPTKGRGVP